MFALLGEITIPSVQYTNFSQQTGADGFAVTIEGIARDYKSIVLQSDAFNTPKGSSFKNILFYNLTKDKSNNISFNLKFTVDPSLLSYKNNILPTNIQSLNNTPTNPLSAVSDNRTQ